MTAEDYILANCQHLPQALHLDIAKAFRAGQRDVALKVDFANVEDLGGPGNLAVAAITNRILDETNPHKTEQKPQ